LKIFLIIILSLLFFVASALFFAQNDDMVMINYFSGQVEWQLHWVMVLCLVVGFLIGVLSIIGSLFKTKFQLRQTRVNLNKKEKELDNLRALPVKDEF
jgi:lipopolysaccharide assembly protein A